MATEDSLVAALRDLCEREGGYMAVATRAKVSKGNLWQILNGAKLESGNPRGIGPDLRKRITAAYPDWLPLLATANATPLRRALDNVEIPQFDVRGSMGTGLILRDQPGVIRSWNVSPEWIQKNVQHVTNAKNLAIVTGFGDSMKPLFNPGDPLLVDRGITKVEFDAVYFFRVADEGFIKRLQRVPGEGMLALSENKAYRDWVIRDNMDFEVFARVLKIWRGEDF